MNKHHLKFNDWKYRLVELRRQFHRIPELGFEEFETSRLIQAELDKIGIHFRSGIGGTGILARIDGKNKKPKVLLRFDMDGLPIQEKNEVDYKSIHTGRMHACGHDSHIATGLVLAELLFANKETLEESIYIFFQPAEENFGGAAALLESGLLNEETPEHALAFHIWNEHPVGWVGIASGSVMAGDDIFDIKVTGIGGHGAIPNKTVDPITAGANIVQSLQTIVARNVDPLKSAVVSVTKFKAGETYNVIPENAELSGTLRYFNSEVHDILTKRLDQIAKDCACAYGCLAEVKIIPLTPAVNNDPATTEIVVQAVQKSGMEVEIAKVFQTMGSEDMAMILNKIPGTYIFVGSAFSDGRKTYNHHHPQFNIDEDALPIALQILYISTLAILEK